MDLLKRTERQVKRKVLLVAIPLHAVVIGTVAFAHEFYTKDLLHLIPLASVMVIIATYITAHYACRLFGIPLDTLRRAILHISPSAEPVKAPDTTHLKIGQEFVTSTIHTLYEIASLQDNKDMAEHKREATQASNILAHMPLPIIVFNKDQMITFGSDSAMNYCGLKSSELFGKALYDAVDLEFQSDFTLESWVKDCQANKVTDVAYWNRVRLTLKDDAKTERLLDIAGYYNRDNPGGIEFIISMFDRTTEYEQDEDAVSYVAVAVHELRTPLTLMRGYIEVFQDELADKLDPELTRFMHRLQMSAQQLTAFVNNILNVAKISENQLGIKMTETNWKEAVDHAVSDMRLRADTNGKTISVSVADNLPTVAADRLTVYEVLINLLDNAMKYSGASKEVIINSAMNSEGFVETVITDKGVGIPQSVLPSLFEKFQRNHRNKGSIAGTGLGLYISKAIVSAHGGDIWVKSKEGEGTSVGFTLKPYTMLAEELKTGNNTDMVRTAHGWIKNHSLYKR